MLPLKNRLTKDRDFQRAYKGKGVKTPFFSLRFILNRKGGPRVGIVIGKKVSKKSTERNLLKRRVREILKKSISNIQGNYDIILAPLPQANKLSFKEAEKEITEMFKKAGILKND